MQAATTSPAHPARDPREGQSTRLTLNVSSQSAAPSGGGGRRDLRSTTGLAGGLAHPAQRGGAVPNKVPLTRRGPSDPHARQRVGGREPQTATGATCIQLPSTRTRFAHSQAAGEPATGQRRDATQVRAARFPPSKSPSKVCQIKTRKFILRQQPDGLELYYQIRNRSKAVGRPPALMEISLRPQQIPETRWFQFVRPRDRPWDETPEPTLSVILAEMIPSAKSRR